MASRILRLPEVKAQTGISRRTIYELMSKGEFPRAIQLSSRAVGWTDEEVSAWIDSRIAARDSGRAA
nr:AlpA family transcriptional regulator [Aureimonas sp. Leaf460]